MTSETWLRAEDPALLADPTLESARALLEAYLPRDEQQARTRREMLAFIDEHPLDAHSRSCPSGHLTASCLVVDTSRRRGLLTHHRKLNRWLQLGGHCDGDSNLRAVCLREAHEESGIEGLQLDPRLVDLDIHPIPARPGEPEHLHLDARFLVFAPAAARAIQSEESNRLAWVAPEELAGLDCDESLRRLFAIAFST